MTLQEQQEQLEEAQAADAAMKRFLGPAFKLLEEEYAERMLVVAGQTLPKGEAEAALLKLATGVKVLRAARGQIEAIIRGGAVVEQQMGRAAQIEKIRPDKRWKLGY